MSGKVRLIKITILVNVKGGEGIRVGHNSVTSLPYPSR